MAAFKRCKCSNHSRCDHPWWLSHKPKGGKRIRRSILDAFGITEKKKTDAEKLQGRFDDEVQLAFREHREPFEVVRPLEPVTFRELLAQYLLRHHEVEDVEHLDDAALRSRLKSLLAKFGTLSLSQLSGEAGFATVSDYKRHLTNEGKAVGTVDLMLATLRPVLRWAQAHKLLPGDVPFGQHKVTLDTADETKRHRRFVPGEAKALFAATELMPVEGALMHDRLTFALGTACRSNEMQRLQVGDIDWNVKGLPYGSVRFRGHKMLPKKNRKTGVVSVQRVNTTKNRKDRTVPLTKHVRAMLEKYRFRGDEAFVFSHDGAAPGKFNSAWVRLNLLAHGYDPKNIESKRSAAQKQALAKIDLHWHDLRHECASRWWRRGVPLTQIQLLLGHSDVQTTQRYLNISDQEFAQSMSSVARLGDDVAVDEDAVERLMEGAQ